MEIAVAVRLRNGRGMKVAPGLYCFAFDKYDWCGGQDTNVGVVSAALHRVGFDVAVFVDELWVGYEGGWRPWSNFFRQYETVVGEVWARHYGWGNCLVE